MLDYIKTHDDHYVRVDRVGTGKKIVVMLHGLGGGSHMWLPFALANDKKEFTFVMPNLRGFGKSQMVPLYNQEDIFLDFARDLHAVIEHYRGNGKVILCGVSAGAITSMRYMQIFGTDALSRYLNIDQSPKLMNNDRWEWGIGGKPLFPMFEDIGNRVNTLYPHINKPLEAIDEPKQAEFLDALTDFFETAFHRKLEKLVVRQMYHLPILNKLAKKFTQAHNWETYCACIESYRANDYDFREMMRNIDIPVTLFVGEYSELFPPAGQRHMAKNTKRTKIVNFNEGHALMWTAPFTFNRELKKFLSEQK